MIDAVGEGVEDFVVGEAVVGGMPLATSLSLQSSARKVFKKPSHLSFAEAAAYQVAYLTAYVALCARLICRRRPYWFMASGGVGMAAVDIGRVLGATVIATGGSDDKLQRVLAKG